ncbi:AbiJ-related protein [Streptomyces xantholiticus]
MQFTVLPVRSPLPPSHPGEAYLVTDDWDDHHFKTTFRLFHPQPSGNYRNIGLVKIGQFGMTAPSRTPIPPRFATLNASFFSLGQSDAYYDDLRNLGADVPHTVLRALNDASYNQDLYFHARDEPVMRTSLLRDLSEADVIARFPRQGSIPAAATAITDVTRRRLFDALRAAPFPWSGSVDEISFLRRIYDLDRLPSFDTRFATATDDIAQHRFNNPEDWEDDWVFTDNRFALADGPDATLLRFLAEMIHPAVRIDLLEVEYLLALINETLAPDGYQLRQASTISGYPLYEARQTILRPARPAASSAPATPAPSLIPAPSGTPDRYAAVRMLAKGDRNDYNRARLPHPDSNQADVFDATHKATGIRVAVKQLHGKNPPEGRKARMKREIEAGIALDANPHTMPILDRATDFTWFAMPWADGTAEDHQTELQDPQRLRALVDALASALAAAHQPGWIHRDIKPSNILLLDGRWALADWGAVRRPPGQTTKVGRTRLGIGTEGFTAPELFTTPDRPHPTSDIYSVGRVIAWALTGKIPVPNLPLLPPPGPWRNIVRVTTHQAPSRRPQNIGELLALIEAELTAIPEDPLARATRFAQQARHNAPGAADELLTLLSDHADDYELYVDVLTELSVRQVHPALARDLSRAQTVLRALAGHVDGDDTHIVQFGQANEVAKWLCQIAEQAAIQGQWDLLEEATQTMCIWDGAWDQWNAQERISSWLAGLQGEAAAAVAGILSQHPDSADHFAHLAESRTTDLRIRSAVSGPTT